MFTEQRQQREYSTVWGDLFVWVCVFVSMCIFFVGEKPQ